MSALRKMLPMLEVSVEAVPHRLYDLTIADIDERREKSLLLNSAIEAMSYLGVCNSTFYKNRGKRIFSKKLNKHFALRIEKAK